MSDSILFQPNANVKHASPVHGWRAGMAQGNAAFRQGGAYAEANQGRAARRAIARKLAKLVKRGVI